MELRLNRAAIQDIATIRQMADVIWWAHYPAIIGEQQVEYMLSTMYSNEVLTQQFSNQHFYLIQEEDKNIGFLGVSETNTTDLFIHKFYILESNQGKAIGEKIYKCLLETYPQTKRVRLNVNRQNFKSINFYFKLGFKIEKVVDIEIGGAYQMNDFVMLHLLK